VSGGVLVIIPTYNESESLPGVIERLRRAVPDADVLIADDNSPDGTGLPSMSRTTLKTLNLKPHQRLTGSLQ
jgi:hypothetical protein